MNSALKPALPPSTPQNPPAPSQLSKPMHPQGAPPTYGQPSSHVPQSLMNLPHNPTVAHSHPNPAHQANHYSLNVPNASQHYTPNNPPNIPPSNHPVPNVAQASAGQNYAANKTAPFVGGYQPNLGHPPNNPLPPVSQTLPATQLQTHPPAAATADPSPPQSNGTVEAKSPSKAEPQENHVALPAAKSPVPPPPPSPKQANRPEEKAEDRVESKQEVEKTSEETKDALSSVSSTSPDPLSNAPSVETADSGEKSDSEQKAELSESNSREASEVQREEDKPKEKEQPKTSPPKTTPKSSPTRKSKTPKLEGDSPKSSKSETTKLPSTQKSPTAVKSKRTRTRTQPYQSPLPEIEIITKITSSAPRSKSNDDKLIVFYKNEFLAVRNSEGSFYVCQAVQNIYKSSPKIRIRWLSQDKTEKSGEVYTPDFYDYTDFDCILTNLNLTRVDKGRFRLPAAEKVRTDSILKRSLAVEKGEVSSASLTEEHPDGIDVSLYKEESQLKKRKGAKRKASSARNRESRVAATTKSPEQPKVRKVASRAKKPPPKKEVAKVKRPVQVDVKKPAATSRTDRAKRRSDNQNHNKVSPVVDQKKARVLAKVAKKGAVNTANKSQSTKHTKASKAPQTKVQKVAPQAKKTKRTRK